MFYIILDAGHYLRQGVMAVGSCFDWLWRLIYSWEVLQLSLSLPHCLQLCHRTTFSWHAAIRHDSFIYSSGILNCGEPKSRYNDNVNVAHPQTRLPTAVLQAPTKPLRWSLVLLLLQELSPLLQTQGEPVSCWYLFPALLLQHCQQSSLPHSTGASLVQSTVMTVMLQQASKRHKYSVCFPFSLPT